MAVQLTAAGAGSVTVTFVAKTTSLVPRVWPSTSTFAPSFTSPHDGANTVPASVWTRFVVPRIDCRDGRLEEISRIRTSPT